MTGRAVQIAVIAAAAIAILVMPQLKYAALHMSFYDLGQYATIVDAIAFSGEGQQALQGHAHPLLGLHALVYRLAPSAATLLAIQSTVIVASAPLAGWLWSRAGAGATLDGMLLYVLSISVWFAALFEFHLEHLLFPLFLAAFIATLYDGRRAQAAAVLLGLSLCLVKETYALMAIGFGLYLMVGRRWVAAGALLTILAIAYFLVVTELVIPFHTRGLASSQIWGPAFGHLGDSLGDMLTTLVANPIGSLADALTPRKLLYVLALGGGFAFVFLRAPLALIPALPLLALTMLSLNPNHAYLGTQYTVGVTVVLFAASAVAVARFDNAWRRRLFAAMTVGSLAVLVGAGPSPISRLFLTDTTWAYGLSAYQPSERDRFVVASIDAVIPADRGVTVSTQNSLVTDRLAARRALMAFPAGVTEPFLAPPAVRWSIAAAFVQALRGGAAPSEPLWADWVVLDGEREPFILDQGCLWLDGTCQDAEIATRFAETRRKLGEDHERVFAERGLEIFRRR